VTGVLARSYRWTSTPGLITTADALVIDLTSGVPPDLPRGAHAAIHAPTGEEWIDDIVALQGLELSGVWVPAESASDVMQIAVELSTASTPVYAIIATPRAWLAAEEMARQERLAGLVLDWPAYADALPATGPAAPFVLHQLAAVSYAYRLRPPIVRGAEIAGVALSCGAFGLVCDDEAGVELAHQLFVPGDALQARATSVAQRLADEHQRRQAGGDSDDGLADAARRLFRLPGSN
jgi:citrate lyase beta subunit